MKPDPGLRLTEPLIVPALATWVATVLARVLMAFADGVSMVPELVIVSELVARARMPAVEVSPVVITAWNWAGRSAIWACVSWLGSAAFCASVPALVRVTAPPLATMPNLPKLTSPPAALPTVTGPALAAVEPELAATPIVPAIWPTLKMLTAPGGRRALAATPPATVDPDRMLRVKSGAADW
ncbi:hypothetical protein [Methylobacterium crusticola]|uniref:hypothetical protein n=1 Tax=Methylobacterium crusticola TaxID=1697972 RepID=UPI000FFB257A|nr:hypothetical protein [Methylobacterium crusticola]